MSQKTFRIFPVWIFLCAVFFVLNLSACSSSRFFDGSSPYLESGTIILSQQIPARDLARRDVAESDLNLSEEQLASTTDLSEEMQNKPPMAPLLGYFPPAMTYLPADNETWLEIDRGSKKLTLFKGKGSIKEIQGEGDITVAPGDYFLQHKQKQPLWYAPNEYFAKRQLNVPSSSDRLRYRRGALGKYALFPTTTFPIHCAPIWTSDVGGLRISDSDLSSIYYMLPIGAPIVVK